MCNRQKVISIFLSITVITNIIFYTNAFLVAKPLVNVFCKQARIIHTFLTKIPYIAVSKNGFSISADTSCVTYCRF